MIEKTIRFENYSFYILFVGFWVFIAMGCCIISCLKATRRRIKKELDSAFCVRRENDRGRSSNQADSKKSLKPKIE